MKIAFYISDHGYGHASRQIALIRELKGKHEIYVMNNGALGFLRRSLKAKVKYRDLKNDVGVLQKKNSFFIDAKKTVTEIKEWIKSWDSYIEKEKKFLSDNKIDLVISDISPLPFICANIASIKSIGISNFGWFGIYEHLFKHFGMEDNEDCQEILAKLKEAYSYCDLFLELPFSHDNIEFKNKKKVGLLVRKPTISKTRMRKKLNLDQEEKVAFISIGYSMDDPKHKWLNENWKVICSNNLGIEGAIKIPKRVSESQNYVNASDLVIGKSGYSLAAEALQSGVPMKLSKRPGFKDDKVVVKAVKKSEYLEEINSLPSCKEVIEVELDKDA